MKILSPLFSTRLLILLSGLLLPVSLAFALTALEADRIVAEEAAAKDIANTEKKNRLREIPAIRETVFHVSEEKVMVRKVAPPTVSPSSKEAEEIFFTLQTSNFELQAEENITLLIATAGEWSEIRAAGEEGSVIARTSLRHLPAFLTLETSEKRIHFFSILHTSKTLGDSTDAVPLSAVTRETIDLLLQHYEENRDNYETKARDAAIFRASREQYLKENAASLKETTLNIWRRRRGETK